MTWPLLRGTMRESAARVPFDEPEVVDEGGTLEVLRRRGEELAEHAHHGVVHPQVDLAEFRLDPVRRGLDGLPVGHVDTDSQRTTTTADQLGDRRIQRLLTAGQHGDVPPSVGELPNGGPAESCGSSGDNCYATGHDSPDIGAAWAASNGTGLAKKSS